MATIENLGKNSMADLDNDEAIELLRQIRLSRRTAKPKKKSTSKKYTKDKKKELTALQAKKLLEILGG